MNDEEDIKQEEKQYSDLEQAAMEIGWDPNGKKDAKSFIIDGQKMRNEKITDLYELHADMKEMMKLQEKNLYEQAKKDLSMQRDEAIQRGDLAEVHRLDEDKEKLKLRQSVETEAANFTRRNSWYTGLSKQEISMQTYARQADYTLASKGLPPDEHFRELEKAVKQEFPEYFGESSVEHKKPALVEGSGNQAITKSKKSFTYDDLNSDQKKACDRFVGMKLMTRDEYVAEIVKTGKMK